MATETSSTEFREGKTGRHSVFSGTPVRLSWGAIFAGAVTGIGLWALLYSFGLAAGLSAINPQHPNSLRGAAIFTGIWGFISPLVAMFVGGLVAARAAGAMTAAAGALHGFVSWSLVTLAGACLSVGLVLSAMSSAGMAAVVSTSAPGGGMSSSYAMQGYEPDVAEALRPVNQRLESEGKATIRPEQVRIAEMTVISDAVRNGEIDRERLVRVITVSTGLPRADAENVADRTVASFEDAKRAAETATLHAADATGKAFWGVFGMLVLGLAAALVGGTLGLPRRTGRAAPQSPIVTPPYSHQRGEAHP